MNVIIVIESDPLPIYWSSCSESKLRFVHFPTTLGYNPLLLLPALAHWLGL